MESVNTGSEIRYPNAKIALEEMRRAYEVENERKRTLDGKASAFIVANFAVLTIYIPLIPFDKMLGFFKKASNYQIIAAIVTLAALVIGIVFPWWRITTLYFAEPLMSPGI